MKTRRYGVLVSLALVLVPLSGVRASLSPRKSEIDYRALERRRRSLERDVARMTRQEVAYRFVVARTLQLITAAQGQFDRRERMIFLAQGKKLRERKLRRLFLAAVEAVDGFPGFTREETATLKALRSQLKDYFVRLDQLKAAQKEVSSRLSPLIPPRVRTSLTRKARKMAALTEVDKRLLRELAAYRTRKTSLEAEGNQHGAHILGQQITVLEKRIALAAERRKMGEAMMTVIADGVLSPEEARHLQKLRFAINERQRVLESDKQSVQMQSLWRATHEGGYARMLTHPQMSMRPSRRGR